MKKIKVIVEMTTTGYSAYAEKYAAFTTGDNITELKNNMVESINLLFEASNKEVVKKSDLVFEMDLQSIFQVFSIINMKRLSERVGMNYTLLNQYATGKKKPSHQQAMLIVNELHEVGRELSSLNLVY